MEYETINMLYNGKHWQNINEIHEMGPRTLRLKKGNEEYKVTAEENYSLDMLHKYQVYCEKLSDVNINGQIVKSWTPIDTLPNYTGSVEDCLKNAVDFISVNQI